MGLGNHNRSSDRKQVHLQMRVTKELARDSQEKHERMEKAKDTISKQQHNHPI